MIKITTWKPDTCNCEIHYQWDDSVPQDQRVHTPIDTFVDSSGNTRKTQKCSEHSSHDLNSLHTQILDENQTKNYAKEHILKALPQLADPIVDKKGNQTGVAFKNEDDFQYSFDKNRKLQIEVKGLNQSDKNTLKTALDTKFGNGKINLK